MSGHLVWFGGSHALPPSGRAVVAHLAGALWSAGSSVVVGWSGGPGGGFGSASGALSLCWPLSRPGGSGMVVSSPSGASSVRSAVARGASGALAVLASPSSRGSLAALALAVQLGVPSVVAVPAGWAGAPSPLPGVRGAWCACTVAGVAAWRWVS